MDDWFRDEAACRDYVWRLRWPAGFVCPHCGAAGEAWIMSDDLMRCRSCRRRTSLTAGTIFEGTRKPLRTWFMAMWFVTSQKNGVSALGLQRVLGLGSYETAWTWLHKLRRAMVRPGRDCLAGAIEVDETYVGGPEEGKRGRQTETKAIVAVAAENSGRGIGRIRLRRVKDLSADSLLPFVQGAVVPVSVVHTDGWSGYSGLAAAGYQHEVTVISGGRDPAHEVMPRVHRPSPLKRWLIGTHQGGISPSISTTTSTNSPSASTAAAHKPAGCSSTGSLNRRSLSHRRHITRSSALLVRTRPDRSVKGIPILERSAPRGCGA
jgi:transposase-like protein